MAREAITLAGTVVGAFFGMPQLGFVIGSLIGNAVDPVQVFGPKLSDAKIQTARDGVPITWGAGRFRTAGTMIAVQPGGPTEHKHKDGGKGGPQQVTYTYTYTHAILVCEGPIIGIRRIWRDQKLVYDAGAAPTAGYGGHTLAELFVYALAAKAKTSAFSAGVTIYLGDETQMPDPELEALFGAGNVNAHRGYAYVVFKDDDVTERGGSIPNYEFEVIKAGTATDFDVDAGTYAINLSATADAAPNFASLTGGFSVTGLDPGEVFTIRPRGIAAGGAYDAWSAYATDAEAPGVAWQQAVTITTAEGAELPFNSGGYVNAAAALGAALPVTVTGSTGYTIWIKDTPTGDNRGGLSYYGWIGRADPGAPGWAVDRDGNYFPTTATATILTPDTVTLASFLRDVCARCDLNPDTDLDLTEIDDTLTGFIVARPTQGDALITTLGGAYFFDVAEQDGQIAFRKRGGASVVTLDVDDLVALDGPPVAETRDQEIERPRKLNVNYFDPDLQYTPTKQTAERRATVSAVGERSIELPLVLSKDEAAAIADKNMKVLWTDQLGSVAFTLPDEFSYLAPADIATLNYRGRVQRLRIEKIDGEDGKLAIQARQDRLSAYDSNALGVGDPQNPPIGSSPGGPTVFAPMNLPRLRSQDLGPGVYLAACGVLSNWPGCVVQISYDGGATYSDTVTITAGAVQGNLTGAIGPTTEPVPVRVYGAMESVTTDQITAGANAFALLSPTDIAELGQARTVTPTTGGYDLTNVTRGLRGTTAASHAAGERFVMLDGTVFLPIPAQWAGSTLWFRPVTVGTIPANNAEYSLVYRPQFAGAEQVAFLETESGAFLTAEDDSYIQVDYV